jgi:hypothetical protein
VTFGAPAPAPPSDALLPPPGAGAAGAAATPAEAAPTDADREAAASAPEASAAAPPATPPAGATPPAPVTPPPSEAVPPTGETAAPGKGATGFETYIAPPPLRPPTEEPPQDAPALPPEPPAATPPASTPPAATPPAPAATPPVTPAPAATPPPTPAATTPPAVTPPPTPAAPPPSRATEPAGAGAATVMPEALRERPAEPKPAPAEEREGRRLFPVVLVAAAVLAAVVGFLVGGSGGEESTGAPSVEASNAAMQVSVPEGWTRLPTAPTVPGLTLEEPVAFAADGNTRGEAVVFGTVADEANNPTLLPNPLLQAAGGEPSGRDAVSLGPSDLQAYRYRNLRLEGLERGLTIFSVPTSTGVATVACLAGAEGAPSCEGIANTLELTAGEPFPVGPSSDYAEAVGGAAAALSKAVDSGNRALRSADTPAAQARAAGNLQDAYQRAARTLRGLELSPADRGGNARLVAALGGVAEAYGRAAAAARNNNEAGFRRAGRSVQQAEQEAASALDGLRAAGYEIESEE